MPPTTGFKVDPGKLLAVADRVHRLLQDVSGGSGFIQGNMPRYRDTAGAAELKAALADFWDGEDVFATAYAAEHEGVLKTYDSMIIQLTNLEKACRSTAEKYKSKDKQSGHDVTATDPNASWNK